MPKERVPEELFCKETPSVAAETDVLPKLAVTVEAETKMPCVVVPEMVVPPVAVRLPPTLCSTMPCVLLDVEVMLSNVAASVPPLMSSARPVPLRVISEAVNVPTDAPVMSAAVVLPMLKPRNVLPEASVNALVVAAVVVTVGRAPPVEGNARLPVGGLIPVMAESVAPAPCPMTL